MTKSKITNQQIYELAQELNADSIFGKQQEIMSALRTLCKLTIAPYCKYDLIYVPAQVYHGQTEITPCTFVYTTEYGFECITTDFNKFYQHVLTQLNKHIEIDNYIEEPEEWQTHND
jgi:hypothetical protein